MFGPDQEVGFPNTAYYLPIIYAMTGIGVSKLGDMAKVFDICARLIPPPVREKVALPYLAPALDAGMATFFAEEMMEAVRYLEEPGLYLANSEDPGSDGQLWLGAANDVIFRKRGVEFVDGTAPGFAAIVGAAPDPATAVRIATELQEKNLYVFMCGEHEGNRFSEQLTQAGIQIGWPTRLVSFGPDIYQAVFAIGFACRVAMAFGGIKAGDFRRNLIYNKDRTYAFVLALGDVTDEWYANAAGAINWGFPTIADTPIPQVLPTGICTYEHVVSNVPHDQIVQKAVEVRGLKVQVAKVPIPVSYGPAFEGERVRGEDIYLEMEAAEGPSPWSGLPPEEWRRSRTARSRSSAPTLRISKQEHGSTSPWWPRWEAGISRRISSPSWSGRTTTSSIRLKGHAHRPAGYRLDTDIEADKGERFHPRAYRQDHPCEIPSGFRRHFRQGAGKDLYGRGKGPGHPRAGAGLLRAPGTRG